MSAQKGNYSHFVKWDNGKEGGRYFECTLGATIGGRTWVMCHDGDNKYFNHQDIFLLVGFNGDAHSGTQCIAYWDDRAYAFMGSVHNQNGNQFYVHFADGDKGWIDSDKVYRRVHIDEP